MRKINVFGISITILIAVFAIILAAVYFVEKRPELVQGTVESKQYRASSKIPGRIESIKVEQGQRVEKGELLYTIATPELDAKLAQVEALHSAAMALDSKAKNGARTQQIEAALNMWQKAQAGKELAHKTLQRVENLFKDGVVPQQKLDEATANYNAMCATESAARSQYEMAKEGAREEDKEAAQAKVRQAQGAVDEVQSYRRDGFIYAPATGEISSVICEEGELVGAGYPVITIVDQEDSWLMINIKETMLPKIAIGKVIKTYFPALDRTIDMKVSYISSLADFATYNATKTQGSFDVRTFAIKLVPVETINDLRPGMSGVINWTELK
ncbi:MAG: HlyD family secretion protein [Alistipes sp.]|nr:HlyD family secretion protein [Candidatus Alistipes equi]